MCFGGSGGGSKAETPAPAPEPPAPPAEEQSVTAARKAEDKSLYGTSAAPSLRIDRSTTSGGVAAGGSGLRM